MFQVADLKIHVGYNYQDLKDEGAIAAERTNLFKGIFQNHVTQQFKSNTLDFWCVLPSDRLRMTPETGDVDEAAVRTLLKNELAEQQPNGSVSVSDSEEPVPCCEYTDKGWQKTRSYNLRLDTKRWKAAAIAEAYSALNGGLSDDSKAKLGELQLYAQVSWIVQAKPITPPISE